MQVGEIRHTSMHLLLRILTAVLHLMSVFPPFALRMIVRCMMHLLLRILTAVLLLTTAELCTSTVHHTAAMPAVEQYGCRI
jgi:putative ribosome biogenesis GTPase RsgA